MTKVYERAAQNATKNKSIENGFMLLCLQKKFKPVTTRAYNSLMKHFLEFGTIVGDHIILLGFEDILMKQLGCGKMALRMNIFRGLLKTGLLETTLAPKKAMYRPMEYKIPLWVAHTFIENNDLYMQSPVRGGPFKVENILDYSDDTSIFNLTNGEKYKETLFDLRGGFSRQRSTKHKGAFRINPPRTPWVRDKEKAREYDRLWRIAKAEKMKHTKEQAGIHAFLTDKGISHGDIMSAITSTSMTVVLAVHDHLKETLRPAEYFNAKMLRELLKVFAKKTKARYGYAYHVDEWNKRKRKISSPFPPTIEHPLNHIKQSKSLRSPVTSYKQGDRAMSNRLLKMREIWIHGTWAPKTRVETKKYNLLTNATEKLEHSTKAKIVSDCSVRQIMLGTKRAKDYKKDKIIDFGAFYYNACKKALLFPKNHVVKPRRGNKMFERKPMRHVLDAMEEFSNLFSMTNSELLYLNQSRLWNLNAFKKSAILYIMTQYRYEKNIKKNHKSIISFLYQKLAELYKNHPSALHDTASESQIEYIKNIDERMEA